MGDEEQGRSGSSINASVIDFNLIRSASFIVIHPSSQSDCRRVPFFRLNRIIDFSFDYFSRNFAF